MEDPTIDEIIQQCGLYVAATKRYNEGRIPQEKIDAIPEHMTQREWSRVQRIVQHQTIAGRQSR